MAANDIECFPHRDAADTRTAWIMDGWDAADGTRGSGYCKLTHSLSGAIEDLEANAYCASGPHRVIDVIPELDEDDPTRIDAMRVLLTPIR